MLKEIIKGELEEASNVLKAFIANEDSLKAIEKASEVMIESIEKGGKIISCGNGGSICDAMHFAEELTGKYREERKALPAISLSDTSHMTCVGNDYGFEHVFSRSVQGLGKPEDTLLAISTSGNSENVIQAALAAMDIGMQVVALTGKSGGKLADISNVEIRVPHNGYSDRIQEIHIKIIHILIHLIERKVI